MPPPIHMKFDPNLLSMPTWQYSAERLHQISAFLLRKIHSAGLKKHPKTVKILVMKYENFMELYERSKTLERENKEKTFIKTQMFGYRPRLANKNDQRLFERLDDRRKTSKYDRRNHALSKV